MSDAILKYCQYCDQYKPIEDFSAHSHSKDDKDSRCKACKNSKDKEIEQVKKTAPPKGKTCAICNAEDKLVCDHDPNTVTFRGWICNSCNLGLGKFEDHPELVLQVLHYLVEHQKQNKGYYGRSVQRYTTLFDGVKEIGTYTRKRKRLPTISSKSGNVVSNGLCAFLEPDEQARKSAKSDAV